MKKFASLLFVSILGGVISIGAYKFFSETPEKVEQASVFEQQTYVPTNFVNTPTTNAATNGIDFTVAAEKTIHAVVHVKNKMTKVAPRSIWDLYNGTGRPQTQIGSGSGVIITPDGYIVTNNHVIKESNEIQVTLNNNKNYIATLVGTDSNMDIALLKIEADEELPYISFGDSDNAKIGEWVLAVGNPFNLTSTVTAGIISAKGRDLNEGDKLSQSFIQTDAAVNPGNSGGALVNTNGELIGINTAISSQTGSYIGYSFAVPSNIAQKIVNDLLEFGDVQKGLLGVSGGSLNSVVAERLSIDETEGFYVDKVFEDSGADKAGIVKGDIIKKLDDVKISKFSDLSGYLSAKRPGDVVNVMVLRDDDFETFAVTLVKEEIANSVNLMNMTLENLSKEDAEKLEINYGLKVTDNNNPQLYKELGITPGYVLVEVNGKKVKSAEALKGFINSYGEDQVKILAFISPKGQYERFIFR
ncbi:trypsin-like peptidase domain-containing protein [Kordia sp. YSTF-M3]|uniref:Trypsin-like peptidase domain-containing protein n=1 Tax=Kordia aestuariivivens TaxID=2759037 RepID=A0ABR7QC22_9FLAO|nr:trypsin-like peptidase domain-containing protein [Kordia aestuariivivens]MBC8756110.1 trypsin-like peptidase domain-containing protein [Kordia aestuariivivens]